MKPTQKSLKPHVNTWVEDKLITKEQGDGILARYPTSWTSPATMSFSIIWGHALHSGCHPAGLSKLAKYPRGSKTGSAPRSTHRFNASRHRRKPGANGTLQSQKSVTFLRQS